MSAVANAEYFNGATLTATADIESTSIRFNKSDDLTTTTTPISAPTSAATNYSFVKYFGMYVTTGAATSFTNLGIALIAAPTTGLGTFAVGIASASYVQAGTGAAIMTDNATTDVTATGTPPNIVALASTRLSTSVTIYDAAGGSANVTNALVGKLVAVVAGVGSSYASGGGAIFLVAGNSGNSGIIISYDEA